jgi:hypothetical protein
MAVVNKTTDLPEVGDVVSRIDIIDSAVGKVARVSFKSKKTILIGDTVSAVEISEDKKVAKVTFGNEKFLSCNVKDVSVTPVIGIEEKPKVPIL